MIPRISSTITKTSNLAKKLSYFAVALDRYDEAVRNDTGKNMSVVITMPRLIFKTKGLSQ